MSIDVKQIKKNVKSSFTRVSVLRLRDSLGFTGSSTDLNGTLKLFVILARKNGFFK